MAGDTPSGSSDHGKPEANPTARILKLPEPERPTRERPCWQETLEIQLRLKNAVDAYNRLVRQRFDVPELGSVMNAHWANYFCSILDAIEERYGPQIFLIGQGPKALVACSTKDTDTLNAWKGKSEGIAWPD
jgi:hypothetical protein